MAQVGRKQAPSIRKKPFPPQAEEGGRHSADERDVSYGELLILEGARRGYENGNELALLDALIWCADTGLRLPDWVLQALARRARAALSGRTPPKGRGRHASPLTRQRQLEADYGRFEAVQECLERGYKWVDAFERAVELLEGTSDAAGSEAIRKSYFKVKRNPGKFYLSFTYHRGRK